MEETSIIKFLIEKKNISSPLHYLFLLEMRSASLYHILNNQTVYMCTSKNCLLWFIGYEICKVIFVN